MNKKSSIVIGLILLTSLTTLRAQEVPVEVPKESTFRRVEFGLRFMPTVSAFKMKTASGGVIKGEATLGYGIGGLLAFNFSNHMGVQLELIYNSLSQKYRDQELDRRINVRYLNLPLLFSLNTGKANMINLNMVFGPQLGFNMGSRIDKSNGANTDTITYVIATKKSDFGLAYGAGLEFMLNDIKTIRLDIGFRGVHGLTNINTSPEPVSDEVYIVQQSKVRTKSAYIGFSFMF